MKHFIYIKENSQRVQRKNFQPVANLPLWKNLIYRLSGEDVYIDTDSEEILQECKNSRQYNLLQKTRPPYRT